MKSFVQLTKTMPGLRTNSGMAYCTKRDNLCENSHHNDTSILAETSFLLT
ncbi:hypothetical protein [Heyndrickxia acidicola]|uniref:Uncharacterized protein n=1 Tax=Heyndrickxia acidicola TaxID=209389 RepID=A0ABU6MD91_9BACI|nr:hypothetical protein [Heyndrickxia acidicola]MED1202630.1 hypothetical protein [Heyndrickxia acidicola]